MRPYLKKTHYTKGLVEWLKVKVLSLSPNTEKKKKKKIKKQLEVVSHACNPSYVGG
jgi:hypothetical protein